MRENQAESNGRPTLLVDHASTGTPALLRDHVAVITGAGGGIGRAIARAMSAQGASVVAVDLDVRAAHDTVDTVVGHQASARRVDVTSFDDCVALRDHLVGTGLTPSVLVNCAGVVKRGTLDSDAAMKDWKATVDVNITAPFQLSRIFAPDLSDRRGTIINVGSIQSFVHAPNSVAYTTSKHAVLGMTRSMAAELGPKGIRVNGVAPGIVETDLNRAALASNPRVRAEALERTALGRFTTVDDVAGVAVFLASNLAGGMTGVMVPVDGGYLCR